MGYEGCIFERFTHDNDGEYSIDEHSTNLGPNCQLLSEMSMREDNSEEDVQVGVGVWVDHQAKRKTETKVHVYNQNLPKSSIDPYGGATCNRNEAVKSTVVVTLLKLVLLLLGIMITVI